MNPNTWYAWLPTVVSTAALGLAFFLMRSNVTQSKKSVDKRVDTLESTHAKDVKEYKDAQTAHTIVHKEETAVFLREDRHEIICIGNYQKVQLHFSESINSLWRDIQKELKEMNTVTQNEIKALRKEMANGRTIVGKSEKD